MALVDTTKIKYAFGLWQRNFSLITLVALAGGLASNLPEFMKVFGAGKEVVRVANVPGVAFSLITFIALCYLYHQLHTGGPISRPQLAAVVKERFWRVGYAMLRLFAVALMWGIAFAVPAGLLAGALNNEALVGILFIPAMMIAAYMCIGYCLIPYYFLFDPEITYEAAKAKSFAYLIPRRWQFIFTLLAVTIPLVLFYVVPNALLVAVLGDTALATALAMLIAPAIFNPVGMVIFYYFLEARDSSV